GELLVPPILRLQSEPDVVAAPHPARRVRHAEDVFRRALRDAAFAVAGEPGHREARPAVVDRIGGAGKIAQADVADPVSAVEADRRVQVRSEEHTSELQSPYDLVCRLLLEKKKKKTNKKTESAISGQ